MRLSNLPPGCTDKMIEDQSADACSQCGGEGLLEQKGHDGENVECPHCDGTGVEPIPDRDEMKERYAYGKGEE